MELLWSMVEKEMIILKQDELNMKSTKQKQFESKKNLTREWVAMEFVLSVVEKEMLILKQDEVNTKRTKQEQFESKEKILQEK